MNFALDQNMYENDFSYIISNINTSYSPRTNNTLKQNNHEYNYSSNKMFKMDKNVQKQPKN